MTKNPIQRGLQLANITLSSHKIAAMPRDHGHLIAKRALADQFTDTRGAVMKIGQFLASSETDDAFACLLKGIDAIPLASISPVIEQALNRPLTDVFSSIEESTAAASLGQVHQAILLTGQKVAVKVQYPLIADSVASEIKLLGLMPKLGPVK